MEPRSTPLSTDDPELKRKIDLLDRRIVESDANNSSLYRYLEESADLSCVTVFMNWDGQQPPFNQYLRHWLEKSPLCIREALADHIREEEEEEHSALFVKMLAHLNELVQPAVEFDHGVLEELNYTFSRRCAEECDVAFFVGGFLATEIMSAKRCSQIENALLRLGIDPRELGYLHLHTDADIRHGQEVKERFVRPLLENDLDEYGAICAGVEDRLTRSATYLRWYESHILGRSPGS